MSLALVGRLAVKAKQIRPGEAFAAEIGAGQIVEITDLEGRQVAEFMAFARGNPKERLSPAATRSANGSIMLQTGMRLHSQRGTALLELTEDTVGRHDLLRTYSDTPAPVAATTTPAEVLPAPATEPEAADPAEPADAPEEAAEPAEASAADAVPVSTGEGEAAAAGAVTENAAPMTTANGTDPERAGAEATGPAPDRPLSALGAALAPFGLDELDLPDPVNFFMNVAIKQRGELETREPISERGDHVVLLALEPVIVVVRASTATDATNGAAPTDILVRVYR